MHIYFRDKGVTFDDIYMRYAIISTEDNEGNEMKELIEEGYMSTIYH